LTVRVDSLGVLQRQLATARTRGYAVDVSMLKAAQGRRERKLAAQAVKRTAEALSRRLGARGISIAGARA
jgi:hypothetical protein